MDADATSALHKKGISATDDSYKFIWFQVRDSVCFINHLASHFFCWCCVVFSTFVEVLCRTETKT